MTLTLSPEIEKALAEAAVETGKTPDELAEETLRARFKIPLDHTGPLGEELRARVNAAKGMFSSEDISSEDMEKRRQEALARIHSGYYVSRLSSSEEFSARKAEEKFLEERHWRQ